MMEQIPLVRVTVYVPPEAADAVLAGIHAELACPPWKIYDQVSWFSGAWIEQFRPLPGSTPTLGTVGETMRAPSVRIEVLVPTAEVEAVVTRGIRPHHPWERPVIILDEVHLAGG